MLWELFFKGFKINISVCFQSSAVRTQRAKGQGPSIILNFLANPSLYLSEILYGK